jgi:hypothetical protein
MSSPSTVYHLAVSAETESWAKLLGITRKRIILRGDTFRIRFKFRNDSSHVFPGGKFLSLIRYTTGQEEWANCDMPMMNIKQERWTDWAPRLTAFAEGIAFVTALP